jgi:hypothetical protein
MSPLRTACAAKQVGYADLIRKENIAMQIIMIRKFTPLVLVFLWSFSALSAPVGAIERVQFKDGQVFAWPGGLILEAPNEITLPFDIVIQTNGMFTVKGGKTRLLQDGDVLGADGMLIKPDGSITPVMDHVTLNRGHVLVLKDGEPIEARDVVQLGDGTTVSPDRRITPRAGSPRWLMDGELFRLEGSTLPARDTITVQNGRVMVQKDGAMLVLDPARSITMNDGTKVLGDGTIIKFLSGERAAISEGEIIVIDGVITRPR